MRHFYAEYNSYGMISYSSFNGPGKNGYTFLQFDTLDALNNFLEENEFEGCNLVAQRCKRADVVRNLGEKFIVYNHVCIHWATPWELENAQIVNESFNLDKYNN